MAGWVSLNFQVPDGRITPDYWSELRKTLVLTLAEAGIDPEDYWFDHTPAF